MSALIFTYTIVVILTCFAAAILSLAAYAVSRRRKLIPQIVFFLLYIIEVAGILGNEWLGQNLPFDRGAYYEVGFPVLRILLRTGILMALWAILLDILDVHGRRIMLAPAVAYMLACAVTLAALPYGALRQWLFYSLSQVWMACALLYALWRWRSSSDAAYQDRLRRHAMRFLVLCVLIVAIVVEDTVVILLAPMPTSEVAWLALYLSERNFSENALMLYIAYFTCQESLETLALRFDTPPAATGDDATDLTRHIDEQMGTYAKTHGLSQREQEVLSLVLEGRSNRHIAQELILSEGTIKTHVHNIMRKTKTASREELRQDFWRS